MKAAVAGGFMIAGASLALAWTPGTASRFDTGGFVVDRNNRIDTLSFYNAVYSASQDYAPGMLWNGNLATCNAGTTSAEFKADVLRRINFFRALTGLPASITFTAANNANAQQAALMMSKNNALSHNPPSNWQCYTSNGYNAAASSNLGLGTFGPGSVNAYMRDDGSNNRPVGHRRWILYQQATQMGTGDIPPNGSSPAANALWVIGAFAPAAAPQWVAWPNEGYCPQPLIPARFSLSRPGANFASAGVSMLSNGNPVPVTIVSNTDNFIGDNTLVWEPSTVTPNATHQITVFGIAGSGVPSTYTYTINAFNPADLGEPLALSGLTTPPPSGATYTITRPAGIEALDASVSRLSSTAWAEGGETSTASRVIDGTAASYDLRQTTLKRSGSQAFHLTFPTFDDDNEFFTIDRNLFVSAGAKLNFYQRFRFVGANCRLRAEISTDGGLSWNEVWGRNGNGDNSSTGWDSSWNAVQADLSAYVGKVIRIRFNFTQAGLVFLSTNTNNGVFVDDISVTNTEELLTSVTTVLTPTQTNFTLNATTAGHTLATGNKYVMSVRVDVGGVWYPAPSPLAVTIGSFPPGYYQWMSTNHPAVTGGPGDDHDRDGIRNLTEYAFGLSPVASNPTSALPQPSSTATEYVFQFTKPAVVENLTYFVDWSHDLVNWSIANNIGTGNNREFRITKDPTKSATFFRHRVVIPPP